MLADGQLHSTTEQKPPGQADWRLRLEVSLVVLTILVSAIIGLGSDWLIWLQIGVAELVFGFVFWANRLRLRLRAWTIGAAICATLIFGASLFGGEFLGVLYAPLILGVGLKSRNQNAIIGLSLTALALVGLEWLAFTLFKVANSQPWGAVAAIVTVSTIGLTAATFIGRYRREIEVLEKEQQNNAAEMIIAHEIQSSLMAPNEIQTDAWSMAASSIPAKDIGGDFYEYIPYLDRGIGGIAIGDVAGKGIPAALQMAVVRTLFRVEARRRIFPAETLNSVYVALQAERSFGMVTLLYAFVDPTTSLLHLANAGHNYPVILNGGFEEVKMPGLPLGIDDSTEYAEKVIKIKPGTSIVLYTDGVVEAMNQQGEIYGFERMRDALTLHQKLEPRPLVEAVMQEVAQFTEGAAQSDDITVLVLQYRPTSDTKNEPTDSSEVSEDGINWL